MTKHSLTQTPWLKLVCGGILLGLPLFAFPGMTESLSQGTRNPSIFNQPPYDRTPIYPSAPPGASPAPEQLQPPVTQVQAVNGMLEVVLVNRTNAAMNYQVLGDTSQRVLPGRSTARLQMLKPPITITYQRLDNGLLLVQPRPAQESGVLEVTFTETTNFAQDTRALRINGVGEVRLN